MQGWIGGNAGPLWLHRNILANMTAISLVYTQSGFILSADGRVRLSDPEQDALIQDPRRDQAQKVFKGRCGRKAIAWAVAGSVFNRDRTFSLIEECTRAMDAANQVSAQTPGPWLDIFASRVRESISAARRSALIDSFEENINFPPGSDERFVFARVILAGYCNNGMPSAMRVTLSHRGGILNHLQIATENPPTHDWYIGSEEMAKRYLGYDRDTRFYERYFRPSGSTLTAGLANAIGYIKACSDPLASGIDPLCEGIGGHIHAAAVTQSGFRWLIRPLDGR